MPPPTSSVRLFGKFSSVNFTCSVFVCHSSGYAFFVASLATFFVTFVAKRLVTRVGHMNVVYLAIMVQGMRFIIYSLVM